MCQGPADSSQVIGIIVGEGGMGIIGRHLCDQRDVMHPGVCE